MSDRSRMIGTALLTAGALTLAGAAMAQDALGTGQALDANPRVGDRGYNPSRGSFADEVRFRNSIVTGNAAGSRAFRGDVGYTAVNDFRDDDETVGSNDLFDFQRETYFSGLATRNVRGIDALKLQYSLSTGAAPTANSAALYLERSMSGTTSGDAREPNRVRGVDPFTDRPGSLRSTSSWLTEVANEPIGIAQTEIRGERRYISASGLRGVFTEFPDQRVPEEDAVVEDAPEFEPPTRIDSEVVSGLEAGAREVERPDTRIEAPRAKYDEILSAMTRAGTRRPGDAAREAEEEGETPEPLRTPRIDPMAPGGEGGGAEGEAAEEEADTSLSAREQFINRMEETRRRIRVLDADDEEELEEEGERLGGYDVVIDSFVAEGGSDIVYRNRMREGEKALREGKYFDAEEAFTRALTQRIGDPVASLARVHSEIGAGLYLSAAMNLETLLRSHPELVGVRTEGSILPSEKRLEAVFDRLYESIERDDMFGRQCGIVLAYLGHQLDDPEAVRAGLAAARRIDGVLARGPDPLLSLLRGAWGTGTP